MKRGVAVGPHQLGPQAAVHVHRRGTALRQLRPCLHVHRHEGGGVAADIQARDPVVGLLVQHRGGEGHEGAAVELAVAPPVVAATLASCFLRAVALAVAPPSYLVMSTIR